MIELESGFLRNRQGNWSEKYRLSRTATRSLSDPSIIRVSFSLVFGFNKETPKYKRAKGCY